MAKRVRKPTRSRLIEHIDQLQSQILLLRARPAVVNTSYEKARCSHGHEMELVTPQSCPSCVKNPERGAMIRLEDLKADFARYKSEAESTIEKKIAIIEYLEGRNG